MPCLGELKIHLEPSLSIRRVEPVMNIDFIVEKVDGVVTTITVKNLHIHAAFICKKLG